VLAGGLAPIRYIIDGATTGGVQLDQYGRGETHAGEPGHPSLSNSDPFLPGPSYVEPTYDPFWFCHTPPHWENIQCVPAPDGRSEVARSVGMIVSIHGDHVSTCSVTLIGPDMVITAGHCLPNPALEVPTSSVTFDYQVNCDGAKPMGYNARFFKVKKSVKFRNQTVSGSYHDYCLLQLQAPPGGIGVPHVPMRPDLPGVGEPIYGIHHPNGAVKKLSIPHPGFATVNSSAAGSVRCNLDVSGGCSGSGLFDGQRGSGNGGNSAIDGQRRRFLQCPRHLGPERRPAAGGRHRAARPAARGGVRTACRRAKRLLQVEYPVLDFLFSDAGSAFFVAVQVGWLCY
jgi:hypothetical protein